MRELLLYDVIFPDTVEDFITKMEEAKEDDVHMRFASPGGSVLHGWGMIRKISEHRENGKKVTGIVDGMAYSMGAATLPFLNHVTAVKEAELMLHKAIGPTETEEDKRLLNQANANLKAALERKIDQKELENLKGMTLDQLFAPEAERKNLFLTGEEAEQVGLVEETVGAGEVRKEARGTFGIAAFKVEEDGTRQKISDGSSSLSEKPLYSDPSETEKPTSQNPASMTLNELKQHYPEVYQQALAEAKSNPQNGTQENQGGQAEGKGGQETPENKVQENVNAWLPWIDVDRERVMQAIQEGREMTMQDVSELAKKQSQQAMKTGMQKDSPETTNPEGAPEGGESQNSGGDTPEDAEAKALLDQAHPEIAKKMDEEEKKGKAPVNTDDADRNAPLAEGASAGSAAGPVATEQSSSQ